MGFVFQNKLLENTLSFSIKDNDYRMPAYFFGVSLEYIFNDKACIWVRTGEEQYQMLSFCLWLGRPLSLCPCLAQLDGKQKLDNHICNNQWSMG